MDKRDLVSRLVAAKAQRDVLETNKSIEHTEIMDRIGNDLDSLDERYEPVLKQISDEISAIEAELELFMKPNERIKSAQGIIYGMEVSLKVSYSDIAKRIAVQVMGPDIASQFISLSKTALGKAVKDKTISEVMAATINRHADIEESWKLKEVKS